VISFFFVWSFLKLFSRQLAGWLVDGVDASLAVWASPGYFRPRASKEKNIHCHTKRIFITDLLRIRIANEGDIMKNFINFFFRNSPIFLENQ
jgi:hypothetical protein